MKSEHKAEKLKSKFQSQEEKESIKKELQVKE